MTQLTQGGALPLDRLVPGIQTRKKATRKAHGQIFSTGPLMDMKFRASNSIYIRGPYFVTYILKDRKRGIE